MKRSLTLFLILCILLTGAFTACSEVQPLSTTEEVVSTEPFYEDPMAKKLLRSQVEAFPVATEEMSYEDRRSLAVDFFELQLTFRWKPDMDLLDYPTTNFHVPGGKTLKTDTIYGGIPYQSVATGNLYRWLEYYDEETGVFRLSEALAENGGYGEGAAITDVKKDKDGNITYKKYRSLQALFNQCSVSSFWGWGRVVNSANFIWTADMNVYNGFIPLGFTYGYEHEGKTYGADVIRRWGVKDENWNPKGYDTVHAIRDWKALHGDDAMYKCYAKLQPGDCVVSKGHAMMVKEVHFHKREDGSVALPHSWIVAIEQIEGWGQQTVLGEGENRVAFKNQGGVDRIYYFGELMDKDYLPFTFAEYLDPEKPEEKELLDQYLRYANVISPVAKRYSAFQFDNEAILAMTGAGVEKAVTFCTLDATQKSVSFDAFSGMTVGSNYTISDCFVTVKDREGNVLLQNIYRAPSAQIREVSMSARKCTWEYDAEGKAIPVSQGVKALVNGENTVEVSLQLSNGEKLVAYSGILTP
ncbi:MAG: hypothetical protein IKD18_05455 [Clostridia bacterium]|nr:hypothetical protein [Clostridia bacterium]